MSKELNKITIDPETVPESTVVRMDPSRMEELLVSIVENLRTGAEEDAMYRLNRFGITPDDLRALNYPDTAEFLARYQEKYAEKAKIRQPENGKDGTATATLSLHRGGSGNRKITILEGLPNNIAPEEVLEYWIGKKFCVWKGIDRDEIGKILAENGYQATDDEIDTVMTEAKKHNWNTEWSEEEFSELVRICLSGILPNSDWNENWNRMYTLHSEREEVKQYNGKIVIVIGEECSGNSLYTDDPVMCLLESLNGEEITAFAGELEPLDQKQSFEQYIVSALEKCGLNPVREWVREIYFRANDKDDDAELFVQECARFIQMNGYEKFEEVSDAEVHRFFAKTAENKIDSEEA